MVGNDHIRRFFPESGWEGLLPRNEVEATLRKCHKNPTPPGLVDFILNKASKIFAILITMRQPESILTFYKNDFGQERLPVEPISVEKMLEGDGWESDSISDFCDKQWWFTSPTFTKDKFKYEFVKCYHLPFTTTGKQASLGASNYSTVEERSIHAGHIEPRVGQDEFGNVRVAIKKLLSLEQGPADQEAKVLEMMRELHTDHMIKAIAYYRYDGKHHFMFPWAEHGNLWEFWTKGQGPSLKKPYVIWAFTQLKGLAHAIEQLHDQKTCRHGDLKPENFLCFSKDHAERTRLRQVTHTKVSTKRYSAPEMDVNPGAPLSRRFDIWSMGCILLEFVIWILYGGEELIRCTEASVSTFYKVKRDEGERVVSVEVDPTVQGWISSIRKDWRCASGTALENLIHLITDRLLVVNVKDPIEPSPGVAEPEQPKARAYASEMRERLESILTDMKAGSVSFCVNNARRAACTGSLPYSQRACSTAIYFAKLLIANPGFSIGKEYVSNLASIRTK
ncbi:hypothetical protein CEP51_014790 [Fusarium floridanum]|uniref:Protein kinase domain-containing protein n=1 Tax=Fusarium floridanum TaxID=1325733 RepID=A0A428PLP9_9HYPO|nr:hypothetical protein CEP51_014790 [Fusarium floridanum]